MRFRERVRKVAQNILEDTGVIDPMEDARIIAEVVREDPSFVAAFLDDDLETVIRTTLRVSFPPTREARQVGSTVATRDAIRREISAKAQTHAALSIPPPAPPPSYSVSQILAMTRVQIRTLAAHYRTSSTRDAIIGDWFDAIANTLVADTSRVDDTYTADSLETLFNAAKANHLALKG